jgi:hypothetical protein
MKPTMVSYPIQKTAQKGNLELSKRQKQCLAASELLAMHDLMMRSESNAVQAFGVLVLSRVADLIEGKTEVYSFSEEELQEAARVFRRNITDDHEPQHVQ